MKAGTRLYLGNPAHEVQHVLVCYVKDFQQRPGCGVQVMFVFHELDGLTRKFMRQEYFLDKEKGILYESRLMTEEGMARFPQLLLEVLTGGTIESLARKLEHSAFWGPRARDDSPLALAEEQFNQYYMRGLLLRLIEEGQTEAAVYLANEQCHAGRRGAQPGDALNCEEALEDLRSASRDQWRGTTGLVRCAKTGVSLKRIGRAPSS